MLTEVQQRQVITDIFKQAVFKAVERVFVSAVVKLIKNVLLIVLISRFSDVVKKKNIFPGG